MKRGCKCKRREMAEGDSERFRMKRADMSGGREMAKVDPKQY